MKILLLLASSSREEPYEVTVSQTEEFLAIHCSCPAGEWGKYCKHKTAVVKDDESALFGDGQAESWAKACEWVADSKLSLLFDEIAEAEKKVAAATTHAKKVKDKVAKAMNEGIERGN